MEPPASPLSQFLANALGVVPEAPLDGDALAPSTSTSTALVHSYAPEETPVLAEESLQARKEAKKQRKLRRLERQHAVQSQPHTDYLLNRLKQLLPVVEQREREENAAYDSGEAVRQGRQGFAQLMQSNPEEGVKFIPYTDICEALSQDNYNTLLGQEVDEHVMAVKGNRETATLKQAIKDLEAGKLSLVPFDGGEFFLTPGQRLWAMMHNQAVDDEDVVCFVQLRDQPDSQVQLVRPAGRTSDIFFDNVTPGSGKTALSLIKSLTRCVSDAAWEKTQAEWRTRNETGRSINGLDLVQKRGCANRTLARVVVVYVPETLIAQWEQHAKRLQKVFKEFTRKSFIIWTGQRVEQRETQTQDGIPKNMTEAQKKTIEENRALLWILVAEPSATKLTTLHDPSIAYVSRIFDEVAGTRMTEPRSKRSKRESEVMFTEVENATVKLLQEATNAQATHPIRRAFGGEKLNFDSPQHMAIMHHASAPHWARNLLSHEMGPVMPRGVQIMSFHVNTESLAARMHGISDMQITTVEHLLDHTISGLQLPASAKPFAKGMKERAKKILMSSGAGAGGSIAQMLKAAAEEATQKINTMDKPVFSDAAIQQMTPEQKAENDKLKVEDKCYKGMKRLFQQLHDAVDPNPGEPRTCPILFIFVEAEDVVVLACCVNWMCRRALGSIMSNPNPNLRKCPFCQQPIGNHAVDDALVRELLQPRADGAVQAPPPAPEPAAAAAVTVVAGDEASFFRKLETLKAGTFKAGPLAAIEVVKSGIAFKGGKGLRMLLTFQYGLGTHGGSVLTDKVRAMMRKEIPALDSVEAVVEAQATESNAVTRYQAADDKNRILIINSSRGSNSLAGINLGNTDIVLFDRTNGEQARWGGPDNLTPAQITQAIARALRPQPQKTPAPGAKSYNPYAQRNPSRPNKRPLEDDSGVFAPPESPHPAKIVLFLDTAPTNAAAIAAGAGNNN
jgi:hypothetical protein